MHDLSRTGRSMEEAEPADVVVYLTRWGKAHGNYVLDSKRHVAHSSMPLPACNSRCYISKASRSWSDILPAVSLGSLMGWVRSLLTVSP
jgi:hypothetical protein